jgi:hypothetical protein
VKIEPLKDLEITLPICQFGIGDKKRKYFVLTLPFRIAYRYFVPKLYNVLSGDGEQRALIESHVRALRKEIAEGNLTPTAVSATIATAGRFISFVGDTKINLLIQVGHTIPLTDGQHRFASLKTFLDDSDPKVVEDILSSDITIIINIEGDSKKDFLNLQKGRPVDKSHVHSLSVNSGYLPEKYKDGLTIAYEISKSLHNDKNSPFFNQLKFDSSASSGIPISTLNSKASSDIGTSLVGAAKILGLAEKNEQWYSNIVNLTFGQLKSTAPELLLIGARLCPPPTGSKGAATMIIGLSNLMAYRLHMIKQDQFDEASLIALTNAAKETLSGAVDGNYAGNVKRALLGSFAEKFFADILPDEENHKGIPKELCNLFSPSTFNVCPLPKEDKVLKEKVKKIHGKYATSETSADNVNDGDAPWDENETQG